MTHVGNDIWEGYPLTLHVFTWAQMLRRRPCPERSRMDKDDDLVVGMMGRT